MYQVSIIIPTYKDSIRLSKCLSALANQSYDAQLFEVIVVNNAPEDALPAFTSLPRNFQTILEQRSGSYAARNAGLLVAKGEIIGFTDSDCVPDKDWIKNAVSQLKNDPGVYRLSGPVKIFCKEKQPSAVELYDTIYAFPQKKYSEAGLGVTANLFIHKKVFEKVGPFNSNTKSGGDLEWGSRAEKAGLRLKYSEDIIINHPARDSLKSLIKKAKRVGKGQASFISNKENFLDLVIETIKVLRPKTWEVRRIFKEAPEIRLLKKLYLIYIRHLVLWNMDFWRISTKTKSFINYKIRN